MAALASSFLDFRPRFFFAAGGPAAGPTEASASGGDAGVVWRIFMAAVAMSAARIPSRHVGAAQDVLARSHKLYVARIDAARVLAKMIWHQFIGYRADGIFVSKPPGQNLDPMLRGEGSVRAAIASPFLSTFSQKRSDAGLARIAIGH